MNDTPFYQAILDHTAVGYSYNKIIYDDTGMPVDYEFIKINKAYELIMGIKEKEWTGKTLNSLYEKVNKSSIEWNIFHQTIFEKYQQKEKDLKFKYLNKYYRIKIHSPQKDYIIISLTDISGEIRETEKLQTLFDSVPIQVWYLKDPKTYLSGNKMHADFVGVDSDALIDKKINDVISQKRAQACINDNHKAFREKREIVSDEWLRNSKGEERLLRIIRKPKLDRQGNIEFVICSAEDITEDYINKQKNEIQEKILRSSLDFTQELLTNTNIKEALINGIEMLGKATEVERVYYWENEYVKDSDQWVTSRKIEWCLDETHQKSNDAYYQNIPFESIQDFIDPLSQNQPFSCHTKNLDDSTYTKKHLQKQGIKSVLTLPIFLKDKFIGFIGFDSYNVEREWSDVEISLLNSFILLYVKALEKYELEQKVKQTNDNFFNFFNMIDDLLIVLDQDGTILDVNNNILARSKYTREELLGESHLKLHPQEITQKIQDSFQELKIQENVGFEIPFMTKDGEEFPVEITNTQGLWNGKPAIFGVAKDITELSRSEDKFSKAFNNSGISMFISRYEDGEILDVNDKFLDFFGYTKDEIMGKTTLDLQMTKDYSQRETFKKMIKTYNKIQDLEINYIDKNNENRTGLTNIVPVVINDTECLLTSIIDISDRVKNEKKILELSNKDSLTDTYNRRFVYEVLSKIIEKGNKNRDLFSVAIIDIDNFKNINDNYGHQVGDEVLVEFTKIVKENLRPDDVLGRYGGEEFIIIVNNADIEKSSKVLERVLANVRKRLSIFGDYEINLTFSAGVTSCKELEEVELSIDRLVEIADQRMYLAKKNGKNKVNYK